MHLKRKTTLVLVLVLFLFLVPIVASTPVYSTGVRADKSSLAPFIHVKSSTVTTLEYGVGYVNIIFNISDSVLWGAYTNTTEVADTICTSRTLTSINFYGFCQVIISNSSFPSAVIRIYDSSNITLVNSTVYGVKSFNSSRVTIKEGSTVTNHFSSYDNSEVSISNSTVNELKTYDNSHVEISDSSQISKMQMDDNSSLAVTDSTITSFNATGYAWGRIINSSVTNTFRSVDAADIILDNVNLPGTISYGLVCTVNRLIIEGATILGSENCRNTTTLIDMRNPVMSLVSVSALSDTTVNITNNDTITDIYAHDTSTVTLEAVNTQSLTITCTQGSTTVLKNSGGTSLTAYCDGRS